MGRSLTLAPPPSPPPSPGLRSQAAPSEPPPPPPAPAFDLDWHALAVVLEAGTPGVDAAAVTAAFVAPDPPAHEAEAPHGRALVFAELTFEALSAAAAGAPDGTALHAAHALVAEAEAAHAASEDPDKGDWVVPLGLRAALFEAKSRDDADAHRAALTEARTAAFAAAREAVANAEISLEEAMRILT